MSKEKKCSHGRKKYICKECKLLGTGGFGICDHNLQRKHCRACFEEGLGGGVFCEHGVVKKNCKKCDGTNLCLHGGRRTSCVFCRPEQVYKIYKSRCLVKLKKVFELTFEQFDTISHQPCFYCNDTYKHLSTLYEGAKLGIDRQDNTVGYTLENSVPCCTTCNLAKLNRSTKDFVEHCEKVAAHAAEKRNS